MVADVDVREVRFPSWARGCVLVAAVAEVALGAAMVVRPQWPVFHDVHPETLVWQAVGILEIAVGGALFAAVARPVRNAGLIAAGLSLQIAGAVALLVLLLTGGTDRSSAAPLLVAKAVAGVLLALPFVPLRRRPEEVQPLVGDVRSSSATTLFGLQQTLQALAAPASIQLTMFPDLVANGERVMADFQEWRSRALQRQGMLSPQQQEALVGLDQCLQNMLHEDARALWNGDAVRAAPEWGQLRATARRALVAFSWSVDMPMGVLKRRRESPSSVDMRPPS
ncbi:MAG: hypothetical protein R3F56_17385 [Planctomycetota bacterium]